MLEGKKVLITGHTGRIGQAVGTRFAPICEMWRLARFTREGSIEEAKALGVTPVQGDFARGSLAKVPTDFDYVLHIAAVSCRIRLRRAWSPTATTPPA
jgi:UDP-glucuronate 4-epimerase